MATAMAGGEVYFSREWQIGEGRVVLSTGDDGQGRYVALSAPWRQPITPELMARIAASVDKRLADRQHDALFGRNPPLEDKVERDD